MQYCEIEDLYNLFSKLQNIEFSSVKTCLSILEFFEQLEPIEKRRVQVQNKLIQQFGSPDEQGVYVVNPSSDKYFEFIKAFNELQTTEVEIQKPNFTLESFEGIPLTPHQLKSIRSLLTIK